MNIKSEIGVVGRFFAQAISVITHPLLMLIYVLILYLVINPYLFPYKGGPDFDIFLLMTFIPPVIIPAVAILLLFGVGLIDSIQMKDKSERIGPIMITSIIYLWLYLNIRTHSQIPIAFSAFVLGAIISLFIAFFINNFSKISLHGVGLGGLVMATLFLLHQSKQTHFAVQMAGQQWVINSILVLVIIILITGLALSARIFLKAHTNQDVAGGFLVGLIGQLLAMLSI